MPILYSGDKTRGKKRKEIEQNFLIALGMAVKI